jgi:hypothetical protein
MDTREKRRKWLYKYIEAEDDIISFLELDEAEENDSKLARGPKLYRRRWDRDYYVNLAIAEGSFCKEYRLAYDEFILLVDLLKPFLENDQRYYNISMSKCGSKPITTESRVGAALILLAGGRTMEAIRVHGLSESFVYANLHRVVEAINRCPQLNIVCDNSEDGLKKRANEFCEKSTHNIFEYCTGAIDGLAIQIIAPSKSECLDQARFFSGNKKMYCINMQGVCDANCNFIAITCKHVGCTNDARL